MTLAAANYWENFCSKYITRKFHNAAKSKILIFYAPSKFSPVILAQKTSKSEQNSRKAEIPYISTVEYVFQYSRTSIKSMHILTPFWGAKRVKFWFFGKKLFKKDTYERSIATKVVEYQNTNIFTSLTFSLRRFWRGAREFRNKSRLKIFPRYK